MFFEKCYLKIGYALSLNGNIKHDSRKTTGTVYNLTGDFII